MVVHFGDTFIYSYNVFCRRILCGLNMKNFVKCHKDRLFVIIILIFAIFIRFYNFPNRITFWSEQARTLMVSANYIREKPSFLGQEYFNRHDSNGHVLYSGALFNYILVPILLASNDPVVITVFFALLNIATGFLIYWVTKRILNAWVGILSSIVFLFSDLMIYHSLFIWIYNFLPLVGVATVYLLYLYKRKQNAVIIFGLGLVSGFGFSLQILYLPIAAVVIAIALWKKMKKFVHTLIFAFGFSVVNLPMIIFDLRHDLYHIRTLYQYLIDTIMGKSNAGISYYYFLPLWPILAILLGWLLFRAFRFNRALGVVLLAVYLFLNLTSVKVNLNAPSGMPSGMKSSDVDLAARAIANDADNTFNVAEVLDFDKRAYVLRYFVQFKYGKTPLGVEEYQNPGRLYVLSTKDYNFANSNVWELTAGAPYKVSLLTDIDGGYTVYKLEK